MITTEVQSSRPPEPVSITITYADGRSEVLASEEYQLVVQPRGRTRLDSDPSKINFSVKGARMVMIRARRMRDNERSRRGPGAAGGAPRDREPKP